MSNQVASQNSTNVRLPFPPQLMTTALRLAPWLQKPVLTRLFLSPMRRSKSRRGGLGTVIGQVQIDQHRVKIRARGHGPTVMLVHGWQGHSGHFSTLGARLVGEGFTVVSFDMPAHGETEGRMTSLPEFMKTIFAVADFVGPVHAVVAHSLGATATALALSRGLSVGCATLIAPMVSFDFALDEFSKILHLDQELREVTARGTEERVGITREQANLETLEMPDLPLQLFHDEEDQRTPAHYSKRLGNHWTQSELHLTRGYGHKQILSAPEVGRRVLSFLRKAPGRQSSPLDLGVVPEMSF